MSRPTEQVALIRVDRLRDLTYKWAQRIPALLEAGDERSKHYAEALDILVTDLSLLVVDPGEHFTVFLPQPPTK